MSKRKNRNNAPNLPESTLERARQLAQNPEAAAAGEGEKPSIAEAAPKAAPRSEITSRSERTTERARSRRAGGESFKASGGRQDNTDMETIKYRLANPSRVVSEEQLRQDYTYVVKDLRSMGILSGVLIILLIAIAQFL